MIMENMNNAKTLIPNVSAKEHNNGKSFTLPEKHRFTKILLVSSGLKCFQPIRSRYVGDHAIRLRTIHMMTGGAWNTRLAVPATKIMSAHTKI